MNNETRLDSSSDRLPGRESKTTNECLIKSGLERVLEETSFFNN
jgi:hypothetical protein